MTDCNQLNMIRHDWDLSQVWIKQYDSALKMHLSEHQTENTNQDNYVC